MSPRAYLQSRGRGSGMKPTAILGATGAGKTTALMQRYYQLVRGGARTDQVLVLTAGAAQTSLWRRGLKLEAHGPIEAHSFFGFVQRELNLFWAPLQETVPSLSTWIKPEFLNVEIAHHLMRGLVETSEQEFHHVIKASPQRVAIQIASNLSTVSAASGLTPAEMARRLALADREDKARLYDLIHGMLEVYREQCLLAGILDYGLALHLFTRVLLEHPNYLAHLRGRYQYLLVDDLDETVAAEQDFLAALAMQMDQVIFTFGTDGGHAGFMGADPLSARQRFVAGAEVQELPSSFTCTPEAFAFGEALALRIAGDRKQPKKFRDIVEEQISADLRGEMITQVVEKVAALVERGVPAGEIAVITPHVDKALEVTARQILTAHGIKMQNVSLSRRLVDEPYARAIITLAGLVHPHWRIPRDSAGSFSNAMQLLLKLDPVRASVLGDAVWRLGDLPDLDEAGLRRRVGFERAEAYEYLRHWVHDARKKEWGTDEFAQAVVAEVMAPLVGTDLKPAQLHACQQLLVSAHRFRQAMERFGENAYGHEYIKMLTEGTVAAEPLEAYDPAKDAVTLATPFAYLTGRLTSQYHIWVDITSDGWYPSDVKELANPHVLSRRWEEGNRWTDSLNKKSRQANAARTVKALVRRCRGRLILAECGMNAWGMEQEGGLAEALGDLIKEAKK
jgi:hypothetical protein